MINMSLYAKMTCLRHKLFFHKNIRTHGKRCVLQAVSCQQYRLPVVVRCDSSTKDVCWVPRRHLCVWHFQAVEFVILFAAAPEITTADVCLSLFVSLNALALFVFGACLDCFLNINYFQWVFNRWSFSSMFTPTWGYDHIWLSWNSKPSWNRRFNMKPRAAVVMFSRL